MTPDQKGAVAETAIVAAAVQLGIAVATVVTRERYDVVFDVGTRLLRVQCKWASHRGDVIVVQCGTCRRGPDGFIRRAYTAEEIDAVAAYCAIIERCFLVPAALIAGRPSIRLRLEPTRNNQREGVNWAEDFAFERLDWDALGAVAQLGER